MTQLLACVGVFAKFPEPGRVKTRLRPELGEQGCVDLARYLLLSTLDRMCNHSMAKAELTWVLWTDGGSQEQWKALLAHGLLDHSGLLLMQQPGGHLGERMQHATEFQLKQAPCSVLIGPDALELKLGHLHTLIQEAQATDHAFIPARDGGYVAMATTRVCPGVFAGDIRWGTGTVALQTRQALQAAGCQSGWLPAQHDLDEPEDYQWALRTGLLPADWRGHYASPGAPILREKRR